VAHTEELGHTCTQETALSIIHLLKERITFVRELWETGAFFFAPPTAYDEKVVEKKWTQKAVSLLEVFKNDLQEVENFKADQLKETLHHMLEKHNTKIGTLMPVLRISLTGMGSGPDLFGIMETLGSQETVNRIDAAVKNLGDRIKA